MDQDHAALVQEGQELDHLGQGDERLDERQPQPDARTEVVAVHDDVYAAVEKAAEPGVTTGCVLHHSPPHREKRGGMVVHMQERDLPANCHNLVAHVPPVL